MGCACVDNVVRFFSKRVLDGGYLEVDSLVTNSMVQRAAVSLVIRYVYMV